MERDLAGGEIVLGRSRLSETDRSQKASFDDIYVQSDPREYYRVLYGLDYIIPGLASGVFRDIVRRLESLRGRPVTVLDVGCSYGTNGILLRLPLDFHRLAQRYADLSNYKLHSERLAELDRNYFNGWPRSHCRVIGLDASASAVAYAKRASAIDEGIAANLERDELTADQRALLRDVDLVISTGCIGYVTERTFLKIFDAIERPDPWVASFVLRMYPFDAIETQLLQRGLVTEKLHGVTFVQRRFHSANECASVVAALNARGIATDGKEDEGLYHAEFMLSRPPGDVEAEPLESIVNIATGLDHAFGRRYQRDPRSNRLRLVR